MAKAARAVDTGTVSRMERARLAWRGKTAFTPEGFSDYLLQLGLERYEKALRKVRAMEREEAGLADAWTGCYHGIEKDGNTIYPVWG